MLQIELLFFADGTTILACKCSIESLILFVNNEFRKIFYYFRANRLVLHQDKTIFMLFSHANTANFHTSIYIVNNNYN
jgi:hypothetical protein